MLDTATVRMETSTIAAFAAIVPGQVSVTAAKTEDAALNMVWNSTHINTPLFPDILRTAPKKKRSAIHCTAKGDQAFCVAGSRQEEQRDMPQDPDHPGQDAGRRIAESLVKPRLQDIRPAGFLQPADQKIARQGEEKHIKWKRRFCAPGKCRVQ